MFFFFFPQPLQVTITSSEPYTTTDNPYPVFVIDYGARLDVLDPLRLFELAPRDARHDVLYEPDRGRLFVGVSVPDPSLPADLTVTVAPGTAADGAGRPSSGAALTLHYRPGARTGAAAGALLANGAWGVAAAGAAGAAAFTGALAPSTAPAGALGFAIPGLAHWAQRAFFVSRLAIPSLPRSVRDVGGALAWAAGGAPSPFDGAVAARATRGAAPLGCGRLPPPPRPLCPLPAACRCRRPPVGRVEATGEYVGWWRGRPATARAAECGDHCTRRRPPARPEAGGGARAAPSAAAAATPHSGAGGEGGQTTARASQTAARRGGGSARARVH